MAIALAACATGTPILRGDWTEVPSREGGHEVISRSQYEAELARHARPRSPSLQSIPPALLSTPARIAVLTGRIRTFTLLDEPVAAMRLEGSAARVYWTTPYPLDRMEQGRFVEHRGADVLIQGVAPGHAALVLLMKDGSTRQYTIVVGERRARK